VVALTAKVDPRTHIRLLRNYVVERALKIGLWKAGRLMAKYLVERIYEDDVKRFKGARTRASTIPPYSRFKGFWSGKQSSYFAYAFDRQKEQFAGKFNPAFAECLEP